jgi:hypothetical protein
MAATHTSRTIQASASNGAGSTTTGTAVNLTAAYGALIVANITNGGTGPTVGCDCVVQVSNDGSTYYEFSRQTAPTTNSASTDFAIELPPPVMYARVVFVGNTGQAVSVSAYLCELTTV